MIDGNTKIPMFGNSQQLTLDELVEAMIPELTSGTKRRKMSRYQAIHGAFLRMMQGLGPDVLKDAAWYVVCKSVQRSAELNDALIEDLTETD